MTRHSIALVCAVTLALSFACHRAVSASDETIAAPYPKPAPPSVYRMPLAEVRHGR